MLSKVETARAARLNSNWAAWHAQWRATDEVARETTPKAVQRNRPAPSREGVSLAQSARTGWGGPTGLRAPMQELAWRSGTRARMHAQDQGRASTSRQRAAT